MTAAQLVTAEELYQMGSNAPYELWVGVLKEVSPSSSRSSVIGARLLISIGHFVYEHGLGYMTNSDGGFILSEDPATVVAPDVGFFRGDRYPGGMPDRGFYPMPPDLAVEVISPTDKKSKIAEKLELYRRSAVPLIWWVDSERRTVAVYRLGQDPEVIDETGTLDGGEVLPGFMLSVKTIFQD